MLPKKQQTVALFEIIAGAVRLVLPFPPWLAAGASERVMEEAVPWEKQLPPRNTTSEGFLEPPREGRYKLKTSFSSAITRPWGLLLVLQKSLLLA